jgi:D-glucuronyl C5-epimerase C-terminus
LQHVLQATAAPVRSIGAMRARHPRIALLFSLLACAGAAAILPASAATAAHGPSVPAALLSLKSSGAITEAIYNQDASAYAAALRSLKKLSGTRHTELAAVIANTQQMAAANEFTPTRLPVVFLTLERNRQWWTTEPLISSRERVSFPKSLLVWEYYVGQGIQIQWLGTFGEANGYYLTGHENENLEQLLSEVLPLATDRAGGIAWEYMFHFDGGSPPWTSGLSQGTALQVLSRAWSRFKEPAYLTAAQQSLGIFETSPPEGVRVKTAAGAEYAEYTYAPSDRILNGFVQSLVGLYDYTSITKDPLGLQLFEAGDAEARAETPHYDTGAWSMYDQFGESNLNYHELLTEFLQHLCERTGKGAPLTQAPPPTPTPTTTTTAPTPAPASPPSAGGSTSETGGSSAAAVARSATATTERARRASTATTPPATPIPGDTIYCTTAQHFTTDLHTPPVLSLITTVLPTSARAGVQLSLSKISTVRLTVRQGSHVVWTNSATVERGKPRLLWTTPAKTGAYSVTLTATDLAGNFSTATGTITLAKGAKPH